MIASYFAGSFRDRLIASIIFISVVKNTISTGNINLIPKTATIIPHVIKALRQKTAIFANIIAFTTALSNDSESSSTDRIFD
jgi:hypothetical protein